MPTIKEVADLAGVSIGTVSHVINGSVQVSAALKEKVQQAIAQLDYHPNYVARSLKTSRTRTLGIIVPDMTISFFPQIIRGAEEAARARGYSLIAVDSLDRADRQGDLLSLLRSQRVDGILLIAAAGPAPSAQISRIILAGIPVVCVDRIPDRAAVDSVSVDDVAAAKLGVDHLLAQGYRRIAILTGPQELKNERRRLRGYQQSLRAAGMALDEALIWPGSFRPEEVAAICGAHMDALSMPPDALFCTNGLAALGALACFKARGLFTPEDIGMVAFDELTPHDLFTPAITTVVQPAHDIGHRAAEILLQRISEAPQIDPQPMAVRLPATLRVRMSSSRKEIP